MEKKTYNNILRLICDIVCYTIAGILALIAVLNVIIILKAKNNATELPSVFGISPLAVETNSMQPTFSGGDLIFVDTKNIDDLKVGDIISYYAEKSETSIVVVTHRITGVVFNEDGTKSYRTQGDANNSPDTELVNEVDVAGVYLFSLPKIGSFMMFMSTTTGVIVCVVLPLIALFGGAELLHFISNKKKQSEIVIH